ncbi:threonine synthase [Candidatus Gracilibacteria bacterium]|nr:threonine synthase [Candidatus Gracilibacteria bacterium]
MKLISTHNSGHTASFREAVIRGLAPDGGLYMPMQLPRLPNGFLETFASRSLAEIGYEVSRLFLEDEVPADELRHLVEEACDFSIPLKQLNENTYVLELFHGPTLAFKDVGARFMARLLGYFLRGEDREVTVLAATSGDTGSAVAHGFYNVPGIRVVILYPKNKVSPLQEKMLTTMGGNITALEVEGSFDDCQALVKSAFVDTDIQKKRTLTSANSINIARLLPQSFYYFYAAAQLQKQVVFSVPSGNFGNLTAGLYAQVMGLPVEHFVAATNANNVFPKYLASGTYTPAPSVQTISNAMDVGSPSNFSRMQALYPTAEKMREHVWSCSVSDEVTKSTIKKVYEHYNYVCDPHGAVAYAGLEAYRAQYGSETMGIFFETAHPVKFSEVVEPIINKTIEVPASVEHYLKAKKNAITISKDFTAFKDFLLSH